MDILYIYMNKAFMTEYQALCHHFYQASCWKKVSRTSTFISLSVYIDGHMYTYDSSSQKIKNVKFSKFVNTELERFLYM